MSKNRKNIRQQYDELEKEYQELAKAYRAFQRIAKLILLTPDNGQVLFYSHQVALYNQNKELDEMQLIITNNEEESRMEIKIDAETIRVKSSSQLLK